MKVFLFALVVAMSFFNSKKISIVNPNRIFTTSFESVADFSNFYIVPQNYMHSSSHDTTSDLVHSGRFAHKAWVYGINPESTLLQNNNHRGYPTI